MNVIASIIGWIFGVAGVAFIELLLLLKILQSYSDRKNKNWGIKVLKHSAVLALMFGLASLIIGANIVGVIILVAIIVAAILWLTTLL